MEGVVANTRDIDYSDSKETGTEEGASRFVAVLEGGDDDDNYNMSHSSRGQAVIFCHSVFNNGDKTEYDETNADVGALEEALRTVKFDVTVHHDLEFNVMERELDLLADAVEPDSDALMVIILTRSSEDGRNLWARDREYDPSKIWSKFTGNECKQLLGKPKIFLFQGLEYKKATNRVRRTSADSNRSSKYPSEADFFICYTSGIHIEGGMSFIQHFCRVLKKYHIREHLLSMSSIICNGIQNEHAYQRRIYAPLNGNKYMPLITHTLTRNVYLN